MVDERDLCRRPRQKTGRDQISGVGLRLGELRPAGERAKKRSEKMRWGMVKQGKSEMCAY